MVTYLCVRVTPSLGKFTLTCIQVTCIQVLDLQSFVASALSLVGNLLSQFDGYQLEQGSLTSLTY